MARPTALLPACLWIARERQPGSVRPPPSRSPFLPACLCIARASIASPAPLLCLALARACGRSESRAHAGQGRRCRAARLAHAHGGHPRSGAVLPLLGRAPPPPLDFVRFLDSCLPCLLCVPGVDRGWIDNQISNPRCGDDVSGPALTTVGGRPPVLTAGATLVPGPVVPHLTSPHYYYYYYCYYDY